MLNYQKIAYFKNKSISSFLWAKYSPRKKQITTLWEVGAVPQGDPPRFNSLSLLSQFGHFARLLSPSSWFFSPFRTLSTFLLPGLCQVRSWSNAGTPGNWRRAEQYCPLAAGSREQEERRWWPALQGWQQGRAASGRAGMVPGPLLGQRWVCMVRPLQE